MGFASVVRLSSLHIRPHARPRLLSPPFFPSPSPSSHVSPSTSSNPGAQTPSPRPPAPAHPLRVHRICYSPISAYTPPLVSSHSTYLLCPVPSRTRCLPYRRIRTSQASFSPCPHPFLFPHAFPALYYSIYLAPELGILVSPFLFFYLLFSRTFPEPPASPLRPETGIQHLRERTTPLCPPPSPREARPRPVLGLPFSLAPILTCGGPPYAVSVSVAHTLRFSRVLSLESRHYTQSKLS